MTTSQQILQDARNVWDRLPVLCSRCGHSVPIDEIGSGETHGWCSSCCDVFKVPAMKVPGWVAGIIAVICLKLQFGI